MNIYKVDWIDTFFDWVESSEIEAVCIEDADEIVREMEPPMTGMCLGEIQGFDGAAIYEPEFIVREVQVLVVEADGLLREDVLPAITLSMVADLCQLVHGEEVRLLAVAVDDVRLCVDYDTLAEVSVNELPRRWQWLADFE